MPTYEYRCANGHDFEGFFLKISAAKSELPCPTCGLPGERRLSAGGGLLFKGSGFYITDYGKDGKKSASTAKPGKRETGARDGAHAEEAKADASKSASGQSDTGKAEATPATPPVAPPAKGGE